MTDLNKFGVDYYKEIWTCHVAEFLCQKLQYIEEDMFYSIKEKD